MDQDQETDPAQCRALWLSVIAQAMVDAKSKSAKASAKKARFEAIAWFGQRGRQSDFEQVCDLAGVSPSDVRRVFQRVIRGEKTGVDFRCLRKPKSLIQPILKKTIHQPTKGANHDR